MAALRSSARHAEIPGCTGKIPTQTAAGRAADARVARVDAHAPGIFQMSVNTSGAPTLQAVSTCFFQSAGDAALISHMCHAARCLPKPLAGTPVTCGRLCRSAAAASAMANSIPRCYLCRRTEWWSPMPSQQQEPLRRAEWRSWPCCSAAGAEPRPMRANGGQSCCLRLRLSGLAWGVFSCGLVLPSGELGGLRSG